MGAGRAGGVRAGVTARARAASSVQRARCPAANLHSRNTPGRDSRGLLAGQEGARTRQSQPGGMRCASAWDGGAASAPGMWPLAPVHGEKIARG